MPVYTYECSKGHRWDEVRSIAGSEVSSDPCATCVANSGAEGVAQYDQELLGKKVPSAGGSVTVRGPGLTPKFYKGK